MKVQIKPNNILYLTVRAPQSGEVFTVILEPEVVDANASGVTVPKATSLVGESFGVVGDMTSMGYCNLAQKQINESARREILAAAEKAKHPENYGPDEAYSNLSAIEHGVGGSNPRISEAQKKNFGIG